LRRVSDEAASRCCYWAAVHSANLTDGLGEVQLKEFMKAMGKRGISWLVLHPAIRAQRAAHRWARV